MTKEEIMNKLNGALPVSDNTCRSYEIIETNSEELHKKIEQYAFSKDDQIAFRGLSEIFYDFMDKKNHETALCMKHTVCVGTIATGRTHTISRIGIGFNRDRFYRYAFNIESRGIGLSTHKDWGEYSSAWPEGYSEDAVLKLVSDFIATIKSDVKKYSLSFFAPDANEKVTESILRCFEEIAKEGN